MKRCVYIDLMDITGLHEPASIEVFRNGGPCHRDCVFTTACALYNVKEAAC